MNGKTCVFATAHTGNQCVTQRYNNLNKLPDNSVSADDELRLGVPLVVRDVVVSLQPDPLLTFGQEAIVAGFTFSKLHY